MGHGTEDAAGQSRRTLSVGLAVGLLALASLAYALLTPTSILLPLVAWAGIGFVAIVVHLLWRAVRALEHIAESVE